jgi:hypothetical protein
MGWWMQMPTAHRLACFRDDIVFLIFLYQRWVYRVDPKRTNAYGVSGEDLGMDSEPAALAAAQPDAETTAVPSGPPGLRQRAPKTAKK